MVPHMVEKQNHINYWQKHSWKEVFNQPTNSREVRSPVLFFQSIRFTPQSEVILVVHVSLHVSLQKILLLQETSQSRFMA